MNWKRFLGLARQVFEVAAVFAGLLGCGYSFQGSKNPLYFKEGVERIYIDRIGNNSFRPGLESIVYHHLTQTLELGKRVVLVDSVEKADARLVGTIQKASYIGSASTAVHSLNPRGLEKDLDVREYGVATEYLATLNCRFELLRNHPRPDQKKEIWSAQFSRSKPFPAANQLDVPGMTSALINESEFERALSDMSKSMMDDLHESMLAMF